MSQSLRSELVGTAALTIVAIVALLLTALRTPVVMRADEQRRTATLYVVGLLFQTLHFGEEYATRFFERFPPVLGVQPWSARFFLVFNLSWLGIWIAAAFGFRAGYRAAYLPIWFFAIAAMANGIAHPLLSLQARDYFPGLLTSPLLAIIGVLLWLRLVRTTVPRRTRTPAAPEAGGAA